MELVRMIEHLRRSGGLIGAAFDGMPEEEARFRPDPDQWSVKEVLGHLGDEERVDFRVRMKQTVEDPARQWPKIPPMGPRERGQQDVPIEQLRVTFLEEWESSLQWLERLDQDALSIVHSHPAFGSMSAGDLLASWCAHDLIHLAQIVQTRLAQVRQCAEPFSTAYAGGRR